MGWCLGTVGFCPTFFSHPVCLCRGHLERPCGEGCGDLGCVSCGVAGEVRNIGDPGGEHPFHDGGARSGSRSPNADPQPRKIRGLQVQHDGRQAPVSSGGALPPEAEGAFREIQVVADGEHLRGSDTEMRQCLRDCLAAQIHISLRQEEEHAPSSKPGPDQPPAGGLPEGVGGLEG